MLNLPQPHSRRSEPVLKKLTREKKKNEERMLRGKGLPSFFVPRFPRAIQLAPHHLNNALYYLKAWNRINLLVLDFLKLVNFSARPFIREPTNTFFVALCSLAKRLFTARLRKMILSHFSFEGYIELCPGCHEQH